MQPELSLCSVDLCGGGGDMHRCLPPYGEAQANKTMERSPDDLGSRTPTVRQ